MRFLRGLFFSFCLVLFFSLCRGCISLYRTGKTVVQQEEMADEIAKQISLNFEASLRNEPGHINVSIHDGVLHLTGASADKLGVDLALEMNGAFIPADSDLKVKNDIKLLSLLELSDDYHLGRDLPKDDTLAYVSLLFVTDPALHRAVVVKMKKLRSTMSPESVKDAETIAAKWQFNRQQEDAKYPPATGDHAKKTAN
jgi:hypothetical protein